ncbi:MAG: hypothetical protein HY821_03055 [Acidobacteria bacterium]|nr:hypothetical protein [Acidobacteriota bacterium]
MRTFAVLALCATALILSPAHAATITFAGSDGVNDGSYSVGPYRLIINGTERLAMCYDFLHTVSPGQNWDAALYQMDNLSAAYYGTGTGALDKYRDAAWLLAQLLAATSAEDRIAIQHAAWSLFAPSAPSAGATSWLKAAEAAHNNGYPGIDFTDYRVVSSMPGDPQVQGFLVRGFAAVAVPEPESLMLVAAGLLILGLAGRVERA